MRERLPMMDEGQPGGERTAALPSGVRPLEGLDLGEAARFGPELTALVELSRASIPLAPGYLVRLAESPPGRLAAALRRVLDVAPAARMRPVFPSSDAWERFGRGVGVPQDVLAEHDLHARASELVDALREVLGSRALAVAVRVLACDVEPSGCALSADMSQGDPDELGVWARGEPAARWRIDRRSLRVTQRGGGVGAPEATAIADLADRAQLTLGRPVEIEWTASGGRFVVAGVRNLQLPASVGAGSWRRVALVAADDGPVAPLAADALQLALGHDPSASDPVVRRIFARPYRRMDASVPRFQRHGAAVSFARAAARAARVASDVADPLAAARAFHHSVRQRLGYLDATALHTLSERQLVEALRERFGLVAEAFALLDRGREATGAVLTALEAAAGPLSDATIGVLAAPRRTRTRERIEGEVRALASDIRAAYGEVVPAERLRGDLRSRFSALRQGLRDVRPLGIDVRPDATGASDALVHGTLLEASLPEGFPSESTRRHVGRQVAARTASRPLGAARELVVTPLLVLLGRVAKAKGAVADDLAAALLRLRRAALVAGERLADRGILEAPDDTLMLQMAELEEALSGEPGAYAARARLRREDDARWARYDAPRRLEPR
jgi:hypothetical protein